MNTEDRIRRARAVGFISGIVGILLVVAAMIFCVVGSSVMYWVLLPPWLALVWSAVATICVTEE